MATPRKTRSKVGVIGLGIIGTRAAANLRGAGHQVYVWSRSPHSSPNFLGSVVEVADLCDVIQVFVSDDDALLEVVRTITAALCPHHVLAVHSTVSPETVRQAASIVESQGARYLDAPFTGSKAAAQNRQLVYYVGGELSVLDEVRPVLEATSKKVLHVGRVGDATVLKIATNMLTASTVQTLAEMLALVRAAGIDEKHFVDAMALNASHSGTTDLKLPTMIAENFEPNFSLKHMLKDVRLALGLAASLKIPLPLTDTTAHILAGSMEHQWGDLDFSVVAKNYDTLLPPRVKPAPPEAVSVPLPPVAASQAQPEVTLPVSVESADAGTFASEPVPPPVNPPELNLPPRPSLPPIANNSGQEQPKKNTLRVIRDFFQAGPIVICPGPPLSFPSMQFSLPAESVFLDLTPRAKLQLTGADRVRFLNGQVSNDVRRATLEESVYTGVMTAKGKLCGDGYIHVGDGYLLLDTEGELRESLTARLERYLVADDVQIEDATDSLGLFHVLDFAGEVEGSHAGALPAALADLGTAVRVVRSTRYGRAGLDLFFDVARDTEVRERLMRAGFALLNDDALESLRILTGVPRWGAELDETTMPAEAGIEDRAVSYSKGCYIGQEIVSRVKSVGHVNRQLLGLRALDASPLYAGMILTPAEAAVGGKDAGRITSAAPAAGHGGAAYVALGYVRRGWETPGTLLDATTALASSNPDSVLEAPRPDEQSPPCRVEVCTLPFIK